MKELSLIEQLIVEAAKSKVCEFFNIEFMLIDKRNTRYRGLATIYPRQVLEYCISKFTCLSDQSVSDITGTDRCTVINSKKVVDMDLSVQQYKGHKSDILKDIHPLIDDLSKVVDDIKKRSKELEHEVINVKEHAQKIDLLLQLIMEESKRTLDQFENIGKKSSEKKELI